MIDDSPADVREMYVIHTGLRREYGLLRELILAVEDGDTERARILADHIAFINSVLHLHHTGEDKHLWPKLLTRGAREIAPLVHTVERQHQGVDEAMADVNAAVTTWRWNAERAQAAVLAKAVDVLVGRLEEHLRLEEQELLPLIEKHITASEWNRLGEEGGASAPAELRPVIFGMLMYEGEPAVLQDMFSRMPPEVAAVLGELASKAYAEYSQKIHGTPTPPRITAA
jgi:hemerythrin-like domain-containing protein